MYFAVGVVLLELLDPEFLEDNKRGNNATFAFEIQGAIYRSIKRLKSQVKTGHNELIAKGKNSPYLVFGPLLRLIEALTNIVDVTTFPATQKSIKQACADLRNRNKKTKVR